MKSKIITLITDFGLKDEYVGLMKGVMLDINPKLRIVDISHYVSPQDIIWASYLSYYSYKYFPKGSIHLAIVDPGVGSNRGIICIKVDGYIFICPDNGIITKVIEHKRPNEIHEVKNKEYFLKNTSNTFHGRDIFAPIAAHLSLGANCKDLGPKIKDVKKINLPRPKQSVKAIEGEVIHIDRFGNIITNIEENMIDKLKANSEFVTVKIKNKKIKGISNSYQDVRKGQFLAIIGSRGLLEISANNKNIADILSIQAKKKVRVFVNGK